jgi:hypothetical protein
MSVVIGIDPHKGSHAAAAVDGDDEAVAELEVEASKRQIGELLAWAERFPTRRWAVESANGHGYLLVQQLVAVGEHVVDVRSTLASRARVLDSTRSEKNDANDARSVAIVALHQSGLRRVTEEDHVAVLRMLAKRHKQLASLKTQAASRLHAVLATLLPVGMSGELSSIKASRMLRRVRPKTMVETERKRIAHQHLGEVRRLEKEKKASRERLAVAVEASGTGLTDMPPPAACCDGHEQPQTPNTGPPEDGPTGSDPESDSTRQGAQLIARKCPRSRPRSPAYHAIGASWARENFGKASRDAQLESKRESGYLFDAALPGKRPDRRGCPQRVTFDRTPHSGDADGGPCGLCSFSHVMFDLRRSAGRTRPREGTWAKGQRRTSLPFPLGLGLSVMSTSTDCG